MYDDAQTYKPYITVPSSSELNSLRRVLNTEYEGIIIPQNMRHYPPDIASHPKRLQSACTSALHKHDFTKVCYLTLSSASLFWFIYSLQDILKN
jgi:hypothetical protein